VPNVAGVYRFTSFDPDSQRRWVYVGEADLLPRRFQHHRTPGPQQQTNLRISPVILGTLTEGGRVVVEIATQAWAVATGGGQTPLDLTWKAAPVLVERAAEVGERLAGTPLLNR
jgi:hypothetical protein